MSKRNTAASRKADREASARQEARLQIMREARETKRNKTNVCFECGSLVNEPGDTYCSERCGAAHHPGEFEI